MDGPTLLAIVTAIVGGIVAVVGQLTAAYVIVHHDKDRDK